MGCALNEHQYALCLKLGKALAYDSSTSQGWLPGHAPPQEHTGTTTKRQQEATRLQPSHSDKKIWVQTLSCTLLTQRSCDRCAASQQKG